MENNWLYIFCRDVKWDGQSQAPTELMAYIEQQEDYIEQLEKESRVCKVSW